MSEPVLVLDGAQRSALAAVRSLGRYGTPVHVGEAADSCLAGCSRYCTGLVALPDPLSAPHHFPAAVAEAAARLGIEMVLPMTDASTMLLLNADLGQCAGPDGFRLLAPNAKAYERLSDKSSTIRLARELGVPVPMTEVAKSGDQLHEAVRTIGLPCVLKPSRSRAHMNGQLVQTSVSVINTMDQLAASRALGWVANIPILVQEFMPGTGAGVFALYGDSGPVAWFAHRRLREKPPSGGVSVLSESVAVDPVMRAYAERLLSAVGWFGPAMVEFRVDPQGRPWLMEVNGRFWGSLQLAIDCGVDFPWLLYQLCLGERVTGPVDYPVGRRLRWLLGDLDHLLLQLRGKGTAASRSARLAVLGSFLNPFSTNTRLEVLRRDDIAPFRHELRQWVRSLGR